MDVVEFTVPGQPVGKGRPRFSRHGAIYTPDKTAKYERLVRDYGRLAMRNRPMFSGPIRLEVRAAFEPPPSWSRKKADAHLWGPHTQLPDADNVAKAVMDALNGVCYPDDRMIFELKSRKIWGEKSMVTVTVTSLDDWHGAPA